MAPPNTKKRKVDDAHHKNPSKKARKQQSYSSPSSSLSGDEFPAVDLADSDEGADAASGEPTSATSPHAVSPLPDSSASDSDSDSNTSSAFQPTNPNDTHISKHKSKRNDPSAFATSISAILSSKLSHSKRSDPVLARSVTAAQANSELANSRLETKARQKLREDKKQALEKGRVKDVLLGTAASTNDDGAEDEGGVGALMEEEKRLRRTAQRGVVKLFNAVRQAQVRGEEAAKKGGSRGRKEESVGEMSKKGFLELVAGGGTGKTKGRIEES